MVGREDDNNSNFYPVLLIALLFTCLFVSFVESDPVHGDSVLIIHSYHPAYSWTREETAGIMSSLQNSDMHLTIAEEYLDWKNYPTEQNLDLIKVLIQEKYANRSIDLIITTDDTAFSFVMKNRNLFGPEVPVVFASVNSYSLEDLQNFSNVTGVMIQGDSTGSLENIFYLFPDTPRIYVINDNTRDGQEYDRQIRSASSRYEGKCEFIFLSNRTEGEVLETVSSVPPDSVILSGVFVRDRSGKTLDFKDFSTLLSLKSPVPVFTMVNDTMGSGVIGGSVVSGEKLGFITGDMAVRVLRGEEINAIPVCSENSAAKIFDWNVLQKYQIPESRIPSDAIIINRPDPLLQKHFWEIIMVVLIICILLLALVCISILMMQRRRSELHLRTFFDALPGYAFEKDRDGRYVRVNRMFATLYNKTPEEIAGKTDLDLSSPRRAEKYQKQDFQVMQSKKMLHINRDFGRSASGVDVAFSTSIVPFLNSDGDVDGVIGLSFDVSDQVHTENALRESEERFKSLVEESNDCIFELDPHGTILYISPHVTQTIGYPPEALLGKNLFQLIKLSDPDYEEILADDLLIKNSPVKAYEFTGTHKNGDPIIMELNGRSFYDIDGVLQGFRGVIRDITDQRRSQEALQKANLKIHIFNGLTANNLTNLIFVQRGYLAIAGEMTDLARSLEYVKKGVDTLEGMDKLIGFMKDYQDLGLKPPKWQSVKESFFFAISHLDMTGISRNVKDNLPEIFADPFLEKVFFHLVQNSLQHGEHVNSIGVRYEDRNGIFVLIYEDNGVGIPKERKESIFSGRGQVIAGTGLILVREVLSITGITISESGEPGMGARFDMIIPRKGYRFQ